MAMVNIHEAKTHLSRLLERVAAGEEIIIARSGKPIARLQPFVLAASSRQPGRWKGQVVIGEDFDVLPESFSAAFRGEAP